MYGNDKNCSYQLRQAMGAGKNGNIFKAVYDEHGDGSAGQDGAEILYGARRFFPSGKSRNGSARVRNVAAAMMAMVMQSWKKVWDVICQAPFER